MKAIQFTIDEALLGRLDSEPEVASDGRSAVLRRAILHYLEKRQRERIGRAYRKGYAQQPPSELSDWDEEGVWPNE